ncbi:MAG TPA: peptidoglycan editing factor PgeF [Hyphomicrobiaceae bacterium]|nr:peptidoglycan editing factor PgeF [Hyphomicrobiaceae bacterium]
MPTCLTATTLAVLPGINHGFFTREGGVSDGLYASLNCGLGSNDDRTHVLENRRRVATTLGRPEAPVVTLYQTHSASARIVTGPEDPTDLPKADGLVTATPGVIIGVLTADCCPVLFADPDAKVVGAAHAGWRGAVGGIVEATVSKMEEAGARREHIRAAIGPCIGPAAYEVGPEFEAELLALDTDNARFFSKPSAQAKPRFDLPGYVLARLQGLGLGSVQNATTCTYGNESRFFSYRRSCHRKEPDYGRQISAILVA